MRLTKHAHACVTLTEGGRTIVLDPGTFTPDAREAIAAAEAVLITHDHLDHFDEALLLAALRERPELLVFAPTPITERLAAGEPAAAGRVTTVAPGDRFEVAGFAVTAHGGTHAPIHRDIPAVDNVGYLIDEAVYHPGDAYFVPQTPVPTLLLPTSGPWTKFGEAADFVRAVRPERVVQIHELMLSELGQNFAAQLLGEGGLTGLPLLRPAPGESIDV